MASEATSPRTVAIIPAYNETATIADVIQSTRQYIESIVVVDDASTDDTATIARDHGATVLQHVINTGVGGALRTGYRHAMREGYDAVLQLDGDGQHDPAYIPQLLAPIQSGDADMVIGSRYRNESITEYPLLRRAGIVFFTRLVNRLGGLDITDVTSGYRAYRTDILPSIMHDTDAHWAVEQTLLAARGNYRTREISVEMPTRDAGVSQFDLVTFLLYPIRMLDVLVRTIVFNP